ncbi:hypothetical protein [Shewanella baltica]|uniref:hypothetical protein n=1 Tax=Shewanella baltica TaxID=62322 RepID=UPI0001DB8285|nr:hypothetical protein [Shewanella baltica]ADT94458.1 hypothetical protein Sbal678_2305 [Shewanella baltica OS678]
MEISILHEPVDGMIPVTVDFYEYTENKGKTIKVDVWVPAVDSRSEITKLARLAAMQLLKQAVADLEVEISESI